MSRIDIVIDEIVLDGADVRNEGALLDAIHAAVYRSIASASVVPRPIHSAVAGRVAQFVTSAVAPRGGTQ